MKKLTFKNKATQVVALMKKDVCFNYKYMILGVAMLIGLAGSIAFDKSTIMPIFLTTCFGPMFATVSFMGRVLYVDDTYHTRFFLQSLPMKKSLRIFSKYIFVLCAIVAFVLGNLVIIALFGLAIVWSYAIITISALMIFYALMLYIFNAYNANAANHTYAILLLCMFPVMMLSGQFNFDEATFSVPLISAISLVIGFAFYCLSLLASIKKEGAKGSMARSFSLFGAKYKKFPD